jgi:hypothetical protein
MTDDIDAFAAPRPLAVLLLDEALKRPFKRAVLVDLRY